MVVARRSRLAIFVGAVAAFVLLATLLLSQGSVGPRIDAGANHFSVSAADSANGPVNVGQGQFVGGDQKHDKSANLRDMARKPVRALEEDDENDQGEGDAGSAPHAVDTVVQSAPAAPAMPGTSKSFDGIPYPGVACNCAPPDTNGEVGATQYVQIVNEGFQVWDKTSGASVYGPAGISSIWGGFGGVCETAGDGDPVVLYDQFANRWVVSQFAGSGTPTDECIAVSTTDDATGAYNRYDFHLGSNFMDYPHGAVWTDGYYFSFNVYDSTGTFFLGAQPVVFDRTRMLNGLSATFQTTSPMGALSKPMLPADIDGAAPPPANAPESFVAWPGDGTYRTFHYHVNWTTPTSSTWTTFAAPAAAGFTQLCPSTRSCVPQAGTGSGLDALGDRLMFRLAYRNFGDHESVVGNFTVSSGGVAGIRWFELRNVTNGPETVFQQSTYQPDTTWRWMGSAAMDRLGDIALGFNASSSSINPQLRWAGRLVTDAAGTLGQGESTLFAGTGSQTATSNRWGDYADMTIDPVDDCTFWFTSEYYSTTTSFNWRTRIGSFSFPSCTGGSTPSPTLPPTTPPTLPPTPPPAPGTIGGHVSNVENGAALVGATVSTTSGGYTTTTNASGDYTLSGVTPGTYSVTASLTGFQSQTNTGVTVASGGTTTSNFGLTPNPSTSAFLFPTAAAAVTTQAGDNNGYETAPSSWWAATDGTVATDANSGTAKSTSCAATTRDKEDLSGYALGGGPTILGIQVQVRGRANASQQSPKFCVQLSWDGGTSWTAGKTTAGLTTTLATYTLGATSDTWGHTWTQAELGSANFRVRVIDLASSTARTFYLDSVTVALTSQ